MVAILGLPAEADLLASPQGEGGAEVTQEEGGGERKVQEAMQRKGQLPMEKHRKGLRSLLLTGQITWDLVNYPFLINLDSMLCISYKCSGNNSSCFSGLSCSN